MRVALIDDDVQQLDLLARLLRLEDLDVLEVRGEMCGVTNAVRAYRPDVVLVDLNMPHLPCASLVRLMKREVPKAKYIIYSADIAERLRRAQLESGANDALSKSCPIRQVALKIKSYENA